MLCVCVHISADRYLGCFQVLAIINSAAMNIGVHMFLTFHLFWIYAQEWDCRIIWQIYA